MKCGVTYGGGRRVCTVSGSVCAFCDGKWTTRGGVWAIATVAAAAAAAAAEDARLLVGRCVSDENAEDDELAERVEVVRARSTGVRGCWCRIGSVATECAEDVEGRRKSALEKCVLGDGVCTVRMLFGEVDAAWNGGDDDSWTCAASGVTLSGARCPWPKDWPRISGCGRRACMWSAGTMSERVDAGRSLPDEWEWRSERGEVGVGGSVRAPLMRGTTASGVRGGDDEGEWVCGWSRICADGRRGWDDWVTCCSASVGCEEGRLGCGAR